MGVVDPESGKVGTVCHGMSYGCGAGAWGHALHEDDYTNMWTDREKDIASMKHSYRQVKGGGREGGRKGGRKGGMK